MTSPQLKSKLNYEILENLGGGNFGVVSKILVKEDNKVYALKEVKLDRKDQPDALVEAEAEYKLLKKWIPNVLKSYGSHHEPNEKFLFSTDLMQMTLEKYIDKNVPLSLEKFFPIFKNNLTG